MKRWVLSMVLVGMFAPALALGEEFAEEDIERQMELQERQMELKQHEAKMDFERRKAELDLEGHKMKLEQWRQKAHKGGAHPLLALILIIHILAAVWVYQDIRQRGCGSGIWIVIALLTGLLGTLVYAVVRLGDNEKKKA